MDIRAARRRGVGGGREADDCGHRVHDEREGREPLSNGLVVFVVIGMDVRDEDRLLHDCSDC